MLTDILKGGSQLICISDDSRLEKKVFGKGEDKWFSGMMSRKKQVIPKLKKFFN
jgi:manganese-dependent inorganic pyrophosphatase